MSDPRLWFFSSQSSMARFFLPSHVWGNEPALVGDEARHLAQVLRIQLGEKIIVFDGDGRRATAEVLSVARDRVVLKLLDRQPSARPLPAITLAQAIPKGKNMDLIVQKSVELGVSAIQPLVTRYTVVQPGDGKAEKWRRVALEACKQCGQDVLPNISEPQAFDRWIATQADFSGLKLIASLAPEALPMRETLHQHLGTSKVTLLIGPEGDFSSYETAAALAAGFIPISLGDIVMRVETATFFCVSAVRYEFS
jgi:16S rRNA (uracil1498-N3)-methyltransferase